MIRPQPWHAKARELIDEGVSGPAVAEVCGVSLTSVRRLLSPSYHAEQMRVTASRHQERLRTDAQYRDEVRERARVRKLRMRLRNNARAEARETGRRYEDVCAAWDITP